ncbi:MAG: extracellular solute-binding protein [Spirochaetia bacterium]|jgi:arabinosaccharide transport system substrate-binding protein
MRRFLVLIFLLTVAVGFNAFAQEPTDLTLWTFQPPHVTYYESMVPVWNAANPTKQIALHATAFPYDDLHNKLLVAIQSGVGAPDIADIEVSKFANFLKGKIQLAPLNDLLDPIKDKFFQSRLALYEKDGKYYGLDFHVGMEVMYYNNEICKEAGVDIDKIKTWGDYIKAGQQVVAKTNKPMTTLETTEHWSIYPLISLAGSDVLDKNGKVILDSPTNIKVLQMLYDMVYKYKIAIPAPGGFHHSVTYWGFMNDGGAASVWMPLWYMGRFTDNMPDLKGKMAIRPIPTFDGSVNGIKSSFLSTGMGGTGTAVTMQSKNLALAKSFLVWVKGSKEANIAIWQQLGFDPMRWDVWTDPAMREPNKFTRYFQNNDIFGMMVAVKNGLNTTVVSGNYPDVIDILKRNVSYQAIVEQSKTPEQALKDAAAQLRK